MYQKLEEFSNTYLSIYANDKRLVFDFKYPRLFHRAQSGAMSFGSFVDSGITSNGLANFMPYEATIANTLLNPRVATISTESSVTTSAGTNVGPAYVTGTNDAVKLTLTSPSPRDEDYIDIKKLVISSKTEFGKIYLVDSGDRVVRIDSKKLIENPYTVQEMLKFFGQFNDQVVKLAAAAILPKEKITAEVVQKFERLIFTLSIALGEDSFRGYLWSFMFPVLNECKYYEWAEQDRGILSTMVTRYSSISNVIYFKHLKTKKTLIEFIRACFGVKGPAFTKKILSLCKGRKEYRAGISSKWLADHRIDVSTDHDLQAPEENEINVDLAAGRDLKSFPHNEKVNNLQIFSELYFGNVGKVCNSYGFSMYKPFEKAFKVEEFYHLGPLRMLEMYEGLIPIDYWFDLKEVPDAMYVILDDDKKKIREWLLNQNDATCKKIFLTMRSINDIKDTINQLQQYASSSDIPEDLKSIYPNGLKMPSRWSTADELHDMVSREFNMIKSSANNKKIAYLPGLERLDNIDFGNGFTSELPKGTGRIVEYGGLLKHCVASYADCCAGNNDTIILSINRDGNPHYTLELRVSKNMSKYQYIVENDTPRLIFGEELNINDDKMEKDIRPLSKYNISQFKGLQNKVPTVEEVEFILKALKATELIAEINQPTNSFPYSVNMENPVIRDIAGALIINNGNLGGDVIVNDNGNLAVDVVVNALNAQLNQNVIEEYAIPGGVAIGNNGE